MKRQPINFYDRNQAQRTAPKSAFKIINRKRGIVSVYYEGARKRIHMNQIHPKDREALETIETSAPMPKCSKTRTIDTEPEPGTPGQIQLAI